jgi:acetate kinase
VSISPIRSISVLALNSGSSSLKFSLYRMQQAPNSETWEPHLLAGGLADRIGLPDGHLWLKNSQTVLYDESVPFEHHSQAVKTVFDLLDRFHLPQPQAVGHRFVSGGPRYLDHQRITHGFREDIRHYYPFAPLHLPAEVRAVDAVAEHYPDVPQVACFDTAFHRHIPEVAARLPLPKTLWYEGVRKYGFHGLSYEYIVSQLDSHAEERTVIAHLGSGASLAAVRHGQSVDTTMGLTPTGGIIMGTRSGDLDPGVILYLLNEKHYDGSQLEQVVDHLSGLLAISGMSSDMQSLLDSDDPQAVLAVEMFAYSLRKAIASMSAALEGLDTLVFTGGIGEHAAPVREKVCASLGFLGIQLDPAENIANARIISKPSSAVRIMVIPTDEDVIIAQHTARLVGSLKTAGEA